MAYHGREQDNLCKFEFKQSSMASGWHLIETPPEEEKQLLLYLISSRIQKTRLTGKRQNLLNTESACTNRKTAKSFEYGKC